MNITPSWTSGVISLPLSGNCQLPRRAQVRTLALLIWRRG